MAQDLKIIFFGTPEFAAGVLDYLISKECRIIAVVTVPDRESGRGRKMHESAVKKIALKKRLPLLQPENLEDPDFIDRLKLLEPDVQVVIAFRILPEAVYSIPPKGTFNLHASYLPDYRGAAPINRVIMNGEKTTGVTTFFLDKSVDTGKIIFREKLAIREDETAGELHNRLMKAGSLLVYKTLRSIEEETIKPVSQSELTNDSTVLHAAPKIWKKDCRINWHMPVKQIYDQIRGLSPYPGAYTLLISSEKSTYTMKILKAGYEPEDHSLTPGTILPGSNNNFRISAEGGYIVPKIVQISSKKRMSVAEFLRGFHLDKEWIAR